MAAKDEARERAPFGGGFLIDPRGGDVADDASSPRSRSFLAVAGGLLVEMNLLKLALALVLLLAFPAVLLGLAPLLVTGWYALLSAKVADLVLDVAPLATIAVLLAAVWFGGRALWRATERSFWALVSLLVQPLYTLLRESFRHVGERLSPKASEPRTRAVVSAAATAAAGLLLCGLAISAVLLAWPSTRWIGVLWDLRLPQRMIVPTLANSVVIVGGFVAAASLVWAVADAMMAPWLRLERFDEPAPDARIWRVAHLSDLHAVGGAYEWRIESGRAGPQGNERARAALARLAAIHAEEPLDLVLVTGDLTDAGRSTEWAEVVEALSRHPELAARMLILPGNHDLNVVDRTNPARLELPTAAGKTLRQMRMLSAMAAVQGERVLVLDAAARRFERTLAERLAPHREEIAEFADRGGPRLAARLGRLWDDVFPMIAPPATPSGLGVAILNSNAETHFSFTNALGLISAEQIAGLERALRLHPRARWIVALHHHLVEYPTPARFSDRIGTALINGGSVARRLARFGRRLVVMHGHRHVDYIGAVGATRIVSAPSPVMSPGDGAAFYVHRFAPGPGGTLAMLRPQRFRHDA